MLTAPTWTYSAAGGPNPFIVPARGGFVAAAVNTESGATIIGLGRRATRFARPLKLEPRGVAIFAQPAPGTLPEHAWAVGYSTTAGVAPRLTKINREGEVLLDVARPELSWRDGRTIAVTETEFAAVIHIDDRHLVLDTRGAIVAEVPRPAATAAYAVDGAMLYAHDGGGVVMVDLSAGKTLARVPVDGRPSALRPDAFNKRLALRMDRVLLSLDVGEPNAVPPLRALVGGLYVEPSALDANLRAASGRPGSVECVDDDGAPRWTLAVAGASSLLGAGFFVGGEVLLRATQTGGDRILIARDGAVLFERPHAGAPATAGALARVGDRVAVVLAPGAPPSAPVEFGATIELAHVRGGGAVAFERPTGPGTGGRMLVVDPAGARVVEVTDGGGGARWAAASDGLIAVPRTNAPRIDLYDCGAPA